jgi:hypothetical protein
LCPPPLQYVRQTAVEQLIDAFGVNVALTVDVQHVLRQILRGLAPHLLAAGFAVEAGVMARAVHGPIAGVVAEWETLVRARRRETDHIAIGADAARHLLAKLEQDARGILVRIGNVQRLVDLEVGGAWGVTGPAVRAKTCLEAFIVFHVFHAFHRRCRLEFASTKP